MALETVNFALGLGTVALQVVTVALLALYFLRKRFPDLQEVADLFDRWGLGLAFIGVLGASTVALVHEYYFGLPPCSLCWWQRIFIFPQIVLFGVALYRRDARIADYSITLSLVGLAIALYHHALQMFPAGSLPCPSEAVSCAQILFLEFGYITYPMMSITLFSFLIVLMLFARQRAR